MKTVYFIRHGQSVANASLHIQQDSNTALSATGEAQAKEAAKHLKKLPIEAIVSSTFARAKATAAAVSTESGIPVEYSELIVERRRPGIQLRKRRTHPSWLLAQLGLSLFSRFAWYRHSDEETPEDLLARGREVLTYLVGRPESHILVVTHGNFLRALHALMTLGDGVSGRAFLAMSRLMTLRNTALMVATYDEGSWEVRAWNIDASKL